MKKIFFAAVLGLVPLLSFGQGTALRATNGIGSGYTFYGNSTNRGISIYLGDSSVGTTYSLIDTNGLSRFTIAGRSILFRDTNNFRVRIDGANEDGGSGTYGAIRLFDQAGTLAFWVSSNGVANGNGGGLTNLASATNFPAGVTYNFNGKTTFISTSYPTNLWNGPTNTLLLITNYLNYVTSTDVAITNVGGQDSRLNTWSTLTISNSTASDITVRTYANGPRAQGSATTFALVVGAGKEGILSFLSRGLLTTNFVTTTQQ